MTINEATMEIEVSQYDYGVPIVFEAGKEQGFQVGERIIFKFDTDEIEDRTYEVKADDFTFALLLTKAEADALYDRDIRGFISIRYSIKRTRNGQFLDSLENEAGETIFKLKVKETVRYNG